MSNMYVSWVSAASKHKCVQDRMGAKGLVCTSVLSANRNTLAKFASLCTNNVLMELALRVIAKPEGEATDLDA